jgi:uncharacterized Tic20 family protein
MYPTYPQQPQPPQQPPELPPIVEVADKGAERTLSVLAHGAIAFGFFGIGFVVSLLISGIIWLYSKRSPEVRFHSEQAGCYQCSVLVINIIFVAVLALAGGFSIFSGVQGQNDWGSGWVFFLGLILFLIWFAGTIIYGIVGAVMVLMGRPFKYIIIGNRYERVKRKT